VAVLVAADQVHRTIRPAKVGAESPKPRPGGKRGFVPKLGVQAVNFQLPDTQKKIHRLSDYKGQPLVLTFYCGCASCRAMAKEMGAAYKASNKFPATLSVFTSHMSREGVPTFVSTTGTQSATYVFDANDAVVGEYHGTPCPTVLVLDKNQKIVYRSKKYMGGTNAPNMVDLARILDLKYPPPKDTPSHPIAVPENLDNPGLPRFLPPMRPPADVVKGAKRQARS